MLEAYKFLLTRSCLMCAWQTEAGCMDAIRYVRQSRAFQPPEAWKDVLDTVYAKLVVRERA